MPKYSLTFYKKDIVYYAEEDLDFMSILTWNIYVDIRRVTRGERREVSPNLFRKFEKGALILGKNPLKKIQSSVG